MNAAPVVVVSPYRGEYGASKVAEYVAQALIEGGHPALCVVPPDARIIPSLRALGASTHPVADLDTMPRTLSPGRLGHFASEHRASADAIVEFAREHGARAVYSVSEAIFCGGMAARRLGVPHVTHVIGMSIQAPPIASHAYVRFLDSLTDRFVACSSAVADMLEARGVADGKIAVIHNGVDTAEILATEDLPPLDLGAGPKVGMIAAYDPRKGHELFVEAAARVAREHPDATFYILGGAIAAQPESAAFEQQIVQLIEELGVSAVFERPGYVAPPELYRWVRAMDVVVVPSRTEAFAHALLEAMICARPVVATALEGNLDAMVEGHSGHYVAPRAEAMAAAVSALLADPERAAAMGAAAKERAVRYFDLSITIPAIRHLVRQVV